MQKDILKQLRLHQNLKSITFTEKELALHKNGMPLIWEEEQIYSVLY